MTYIEDKKEYRKKRLFIAFDLPAELKEYLFNVTSVLNKKDREIRPVPAANIHLTLRFLGDTFVDKIKKISGAIEATVLSQKGFNYSIGQKFEAFPDVYRSKILYVPVNKGAGLVEDVFMELENNLSRIKIRKENRKFVSHITVARVKKIKDISDIVKDLKLDLDKEFICKKITLFESILKPSGAEYIIIDEYELK